VLNLFFFALLFYGGQPFLEAGDLPFGDSKFPCLFLCDEL